MHDCSDGLYFDPAPAPRRRSPPLSVSVVFEGGIGGFVSGSIGLGPPPDPPSPGLAEAVWSKFFLELVDILRDAWVALREALRNIVRNQRVMLSTRPGMES